MPRLCHLSRLKGQSFGFHLGVDQISQALEVRAVAPWSPAKHGGLREGDRVLEINEEFVDKVDLHRVGVQQTFVPLQVPQIKPSFGSSLVAKVARNIRTCGVNLFLLVLNTEDYQQVLQAFPPGI